MRQLRSALRHTPTHTQRIQQAAFSAMAAVGAGAGAGAGVATGTRSVGTLFSSAAAACASLRAAPLAAGGLQAATMQASRSVPTSIVHANAGSSNCKASTLLSVLLTIVALLRLKLVGLSAAAAWCASLPRGGYRVLLLLLSVRLPSALATTMMVGMTTQMQFQTSRHSKMVWLLRAMLTTVAAFVASSIVGCVSLQVMARRIHSLSPFYLSTPFIRHCLLQMFIDSKKLFHTVLSSLDFSPVVQSLLLD